MASSWVFLREYYRGGVQQRDHGAIEVGNVRGQVECEGEVECKGKVGYKGEVECEGKVEYEGKVWKTFW